jgi:ribose transport system substrate-binding protein
MGSRTAIAGCCGALLFAAACTPSGRAGKLEIVLVTKAMDSEFWLRVKHGAEAAARSSAEVRLTVLAPEKEINIDQQVTILEDQVVKRVAALAVAPTGLWEIVPVLERAKAAGIPVLIADTDLPWAGKRAFIGIDNRTGGKMAGAFVAQAIGGRGKVAVISGIPGVATHAGRVAGFREEIAKSPGVECVAIQPANSDRAMAMAVMENILTLHPDLRAVFATSGQMALGAVEAIAAKRLTGKVMLVGFDAERESLRALQAGALSAVIAQNPERIGWETASAAIQAARGHPVVPWIDTGTTVITPSNVAQFLK